MSRNPCPGTRKERASDPANWNPGGHLFRKKESRFPKQGSMPWVTPLLLTGLVETTQETSSKTIPRLLLQLICLLSLSDQPRSALYCIRDRNHCPVFGLVTFRSV